MFAQVVEDGPEANTYFLLKLLFSSISKDNRTSHQQLPPINKPLPSKPSPVMSRPKKPSLPSPSPVAKPRVPPKPKMCSDDEVMFLVCLYICFDSVNCTNHKIDCTAVPWPFLVSMLQIILHVTGSDLQVPCWSLRDISSIKKVL